MTKNLGGGTTNMLSIYASVVIITGVRLEDKQALASESRCR
jgi:hypothetical protein